jgi:hypothetical protein
MAWLAEQFGLDTWKKGRLVEPTDQFFPDRFGTSEQAVQQILARVCGYMHVDPGKVTLRVCDDDPHSQPERPEGAPPLELEKGYHYRLDGKNVVAIKKSDLSDTMEVVATIAHELAHVRLIEARRSTGKDKDHEPLADLATVFFGLGVFTANSTCRFRQWREDGRGYWKADAPGFLNERGFGYALALWTIIRNEEKPAWERHLRLDVRTYLTQAIGYLIANPSDRPKIAIPESQ